jgi:hypothetical protein
MESESKMVMVQHVAKSKEVTPHTYYCYLSFTEYFEKKNEFMNIIIFARLNISPIRKTT